MRFDAGPIEVPHDANGQLIRSPEGFITFNSYPARANAILRYRNPDGSWRREYRPASEILKMDSLESIAGKPVTVRRHPPQMLDPKNVHKYQSGAFANDVHVVGDGLIKVAINMHRQDGIDAVLKDGLRQLSAGYRTDALEEPGTFRGERYDAVQTSVFYNHGTVLERGRAGAECGIPVPITYRMDEDEEFHENPQLVQYFDMAIREDAMNFNQNRRVVMAKIRDGLLPVRLDADFDLAVAQVLTQALESGKNAESRLDAVNLELAEEKQKRLDAEQELDVAQGALYYLEDGSNSRQDMEEDADYEAGEDDEMPYKKKKAKKDMAADKRSDSDDSDEDRFDSEDVMEIAYGLANQIVQTRTDAVDILSRIEPKEDVELRLDMSPYELMAHTVNGYFPDIEESRYDDESYIEARFDALLGMARQIEAQSGDGDHYDSDPGTLVAQDGYEKQNHRRDAEDLDGLISASHGSYSTRSVIPRRGPASPDKMDPIQRKMNAWMDPSKVHKGMYGNIGIGR